MERETLKAHKVILDKAKEVLDGLYAQNPAFNDFIDSASTFYFKKSEGLFHIERDTYIDELYNWKKTVKKTEYSDILDFIGKEGKNTLMELVQGIQRKRIAPFVGTGLSAPLDFPSWKQALKEIRSKFDDVPLPKVDQFIDENKYLEAAEALFNTDNRTFKSYISDRFTLKPDITQSDILISALQYLPEIAHGCVITTNYDKVLEEVFKISGKSFDGFMHGVQNKNKFVTDLIKGDRCILKLHGSVGEEDSYIFTKTQYNKAYGATLSFKKPLPKTLRQIYISHSLLFLGCSLEQDRTLELFQTIKREDQFDIPQHFAILPKPTDSVAKRDKENYLREINIKTIWYPDGEHDYVEKILKLAVEFSKNKNLL